MAKYNHWQVIATASQTERVPKVPGAWYFGLPFVMDPNVSWENYFSGVEPRAFIVGIHPEGHTEEGKVYPLDLKTIIEGIDPDLDPEDPTDAAKIEAAQAEIKNFLGLCIEGTDYENDPNMTVALAGGIPLRYVQQTQTGADAVDAYTVDDDVVAVLEVLGIKLLKGHIFWNTVQ